MAKATMADLTQSYLNKKDLWSYMIRTRFSMNMDDADDCLSAGIERCIKYLNSENAGFEGRNDCSLDTWIWNVIRNTTINFIRQRDGTLRGANNMVSLHQQFDDDDGSMNLSFDEIAYSQAYDKSIYSVDYEQQVALAGLIDEVYKSLEGLPEFVAGVFIDRVLEDMTYVDVMDKWGITYENARIRVFQARQHIKQNIAPHIIEDFGLTFVIDDEVEDA